MASPASRQASMARAEDSSRSFDSQVNPSPPLIQSTPSSRAIFSSPTFQRSDLMNWTTATRQPRASARSITPKAAVDFPLPCPVFTSTSEGAMTRLGSVMQSLQERVDVEVRLDGVGERVELLVEGARRRLTDDRLDEVGLLEQAVEVDAEHLGLREGEVLPEHGRPGGVAVPDLVAGDLETREGRPRPRQLREACAR